MATLERMPGHPRLYRRNAVYYHRAAIPKDIVDTYPKSEETFSLKTKDHAEAVRLVRIAASEVDRKFDAHRRQLTRPAQDELTAEQLQLAHDVYYQHLLEEDDEIRTSGFADYTAAKFFDDAEQMTSDLAGAVRSQYARGELDTFFVGEAEDVLTWDNVDIRLSPTSSSWRALARKLQEAYIRASEAIQKRFAGEVVETPPSTSSGPHATSGGPLLSELFESHKAEAERTDAWSPKLVDDYQVWTSMFIELRGDRPILDYKKQDARAFKDLLVGLPTNRNKLALTKGLPLQDAVKVAAEHELPTLAVSTVNKALGRLQAVWNWADRQLDEHVPDIFSPMKLKETARPRDEANPFSLEQLQAIFSGPLFTGCRSERYRTTPGDTNMSSTSWYWLPLLGLWTGARLNELCQLTVNDVENEGEIPFLRIREGDETQRTKGHKHRLVPIHPELVRLGFLSYVLLHRDKGSVRLFPNLKLDSQGYYSDRPSKDFANYINKLEIKTSKTSFHSFRHNFKDACRHAGVSRDTNDVLLGHALPGMSGRYGDGKIPLPIMYEAICQIEYPGLDLTGVNRFTG